MTDKTKAFVELVREMRAAQKQYFASRSTLYLQESKQLEKRVDAQVADLLATARQGKLI